MHMHVCAHVRMQVYMYVFYAHQTHEGTYICMYYVHVCVCAHDRYVPYGHVTHEGVHICITYYVHVCICAPDM
jgi:hypothetical protein